MDLTRKKEEIKNNCKESMDDDFKKNLNDKEEMDTDNEMDGNKAEQLSNAAAFDLGSETNTQEISIKFKDRLIAMDCPNSTYGDYGIVRIDHLVLDFIHMKKNLGKMYRKFMVSLIAQGMHHYECDLQQILINYINYHILLILN